MEIADSYAPNAKDPKLCATLMLWKKSGSNWTKAELMPVQKIRYQPSNKTVEVRLAKGEQKIVVFD